MGALSTRLLRDKPDHPPNPTNIRDYPLSLAFNLCCLPGNSLPVLSGVSL